MSLFKKVFKGIKKVVKKIGKRIKKIAKGIGKAFGKLGVLGQIGLMFIPGLGPLLSGMLGTLGTGVASFMSTTFGAVGKAAVGGFKAIMGGVKAAAGAMGKVFGTVTDAVMGGVNWITNTVSGGKFKTIGDVFDGFSGWVQDTGKKIFGVPAQTPDIISKVDDPFGISKGYEASFKFEKPKSLLDVPDFGEIPSLEAASIVETSLPTYESEIDKLKDYTSGVEDAAKNANSTWDKIVTKGKEELLTGVTSGIQQKGRELVTGKPPTPNYIKNYIPDWMSDVSALDSNVVNSTDFALQQKGGMYGSNGETIASFGQEFSRNFMQDDPYKTVMASLATPSSLPSGG
jgi:hypothetical protein